MMQQFDFFRAETVKQVCERLHNPGRVIIAGGTDLIPQIRAGKIKPTEIIDISHINSLKDIRKVGNEYFIGSMVTFHDMMKNEMISKNSPLLWQAARELGSPMTRSRATIGGNIANASPAADSLPALLCMNAILHLQSINGDRKVSIEEFLKGPGQNTLEQGEFIEWISFMVPSPDYHQAYIKNGTRRGMSISISSVAVSFYQEDGLIRNPCIAVGAVAPTAMRCPAAEKVLAGMKPTQENFRETARIASCETLPISDIRASREYREKTVAVLIERALSTACLASASRR